MQYGIQRESHRFGFKDCSSLQQVASEAVFAGLLKMPWDNYSLLSLALNIFFTELDDGTTAPEAINRAMLSDIVSRYNTMSSPNINRDSFAGEAYDTFMEVAPDDFRIWLYQQKTARHPLTELPKKLLELHYQKMESNYNPN